MHRARKNELPSIACLLNKPVEGPHQPLEVLVAVQHRHTQDVVIKSETSGFCLVQWRPSVIDDRGLVFFQHQLPSDLVLRILRQKDNSRGGARRHKAGQADQTSLQAAWEGFQPGCRVGNRACDYKYFRARREERSEIALTVENVDVPPLEKKRKYDLFPQRTREEIRRS